MPADLGLTKKDMEHTETLAPAARLQDASAAFQAGRLDQAFSAFSQLCHDPVVGIDAYRGMAAVSWRRGQRSSALEYLQQALTINADSVDVRADLALMLMLAGQREQALPHWERVIEFRPSDADVWHNYAKLLGDLGRLEPSRAAFERSLSLKPGRVMTLMAYAKMLAQCGDTAASEGMWNRVIGLQPSAMDGYQGLAQVQFEQGHLDRAIETYRLGVQAVPDSADLQMGLAQMLEDTGDRDGAEVAFRRALELRPGWALAMEGLLTLIRGKAETPLLEQAQAIVNDPGRPPQDRANVGFGLGKALDALDRRAEAFQAWRVANAARRTQVGAYNRERLTRRVDRTIQAFSPELVQRLAGLGSPDDRPVFVLGMPRSGTSLVEQIISAHPEAEGYGELREISQIAAQMTARTGSIQRWPEVIAAVDEDVLRQAAADYVQLVGKRQPLTAKRFVDKAPLNFFHVGLIALLFPNARIVWCRRDPRDVCMSIYGENFALEQSFAIELVDLGFFYREYMRLMRHWQQCLPGRIYECVYEELVADPEAQARRLIDAVGLPWDDICLKFYEQDRPVLTPSRWQVRQPMYSKSVGRWKRYEAWLGPLVEELGDEVT